MSEEPDYEAIERALAERAQRRREAAGLAI